MKKILLWNKILKAKGLYVKLWNPNANAKKIRFYGNIGTNPWNSDICDYIESSVFPCVKAEVNSIVGNQADVEVRWLWNHPWEINCKAEATITNQDLKYSDPSVFCGGVGYWQITIDKKLIDTDRFTLVTVWDNEAGLLKSNLTSAQFINLLDATLTIMPLDEQKATLQPIGSTFDVSTNRKNHAAHREVFDGLRKQLGDATRSLGYKKGDIDPATLDRIVTDAIGSYKATIENCIAELLKSTRP